MQQELSAELESLEKEIDAEHCANPLVRRPFSEAVWYYLAFCEDQTLKHFYWDGTNGPQETSCVVDRIVCGMKTPIRWLWNHKSSLGTVPTAYEPDSYQASWDLSKLGYEYDIFERAFIYARAGTIKLELRGETLHPDSSFREDTRYEAYDRLAIPDFTMTPSIDDNILGEIDRIVVVNEDQFNYLATSELFDRVGKILSPALDASYWLPSTWQLPRYNFGDFGSIVQAIQVLAFVHHLARVNAANKGCIGIGYARSHLVISRPELMAQIRQIVSLDNDKVRAVVEDVTYGAREIRNPDPAIQPLIPITADQFAISPSLLLGVNAERNLTKLLNRLPAEKSLYSELSNQRESISRERIKRDLDSLGFRFCHGRLTGRSQLPDLDLVIIDDIERECLVLELKAFMQPAEPREILEKSEEIAKATSQIRSLRDEFERSREGFDELLRINASYKVCFAVTSETSAGTAMVQDTTIPVVLTPHLLRRLRAVRSLRTVNQWIATRNYLPVEGRDYMVMDVLAKVGRWSVKWYGIKPLIRGQF